MNEYNIDFFECEWCYFIREELFTTRLFDDHVIQRVDDTTSSTVCDFCGYGFPELEHEVEHAS